MTLYLDTSALVELVAPRRDVNPLIAAVAGADRIITAVITLAEATCALERARRGGILRRSQHRRARAEVWSAWPGLGRIQVDEILATRGAELGEHHGLRGYDAIHLSVALSAALHEAVTLASFDDELVRAARTEGLPTVG